MPSGWPKHTTSGRATGRAVWEGHGQRHAEYRNAGEGQRRPRTLGDFPRSAVGLGILAAPDAHSVCILCQPGLIMQAPWWNNLFHLAGGMLAAMTPPAPELCCELQHYSPPLQPWRLRG